MGLLGKLFGNNEDNFEGEFENWAAKASKEELSEALEQNRQKWLKTGDYGPTEDILVREMGNRLKEEWENDPNRDPNYRWTDKNRWE